MLSVDCFQFVHNYFHYDFDKIFWKTAMIREEKYHEFPSAIFAETLIFSLSGKCCATLFTFVKISLRNITPHLDKTPNNLLRVHSRRGRGQIQMPFTKYFI